LKTPEKPEILDEHLPHGGGDVACLLRGRAARQPLSPFQSSLLCGVYITATTASIRPINPTQLVSRILPTEISYIVFLLFAPPKRGIYFFI
jgi:hypothetical protein